MSDSKIPKGFVLLTGAFNGKKMLFPASRIVAFETETKYQAGSKHASNCVIDSLDSDVNGMGYAVAEPFEEVKSAMVRALGAQE